MRGAVVKRLRRVIYGKGHHPGPVLYVRVTKGTIRADKLRTFYQWAKRDYKGIEERVADGRQA